MEIKPLRRIEHFLAKIAGSPYAKNLTPVTRKEYWLSQIKGMPVATEADAGKVPTVQEDGSYALAESGGGGGGSAPLIVDMSENEGLYTANKTWKQIYDAFVGGTTVLIHMPDVGSGEYVYYKNDYALVVSVYEVPTDGYYYVNFVTKSENISSMSAYESPDDYPSYSTD